MHRLHLIFWFVSCSFAGLRKMTYRCRWYFLSSVFVFLPVDLNLYSIGRLFGEMSNGRRRWREEGFVAWAVAH
jgi:hypothetical protein